MTSCPGSKAMAIVLTTVCSDVEGEYGMPPRFTGIFTETVRPRLVQVQGSVLFGNMAARRRQERGGGLCTAQHRSGSSRLQGIER